jgi:hypothetical protein
MISDVNSLLDYLSEETEEKHISNGESDDNVYEELNEEDYDVPEEEVNEEEGGELDSVNVEEFGIDGEDAAEFIVEGIDSAQSLILKTLIIRKRFGSLDHFFEVKDEDYDRWSRWEEMLDDMLHIKDSHKQALTKSLSRILAKASIKTNPWHVVLVTILLIAIDRYMLYRSFTAKNED